MPKKAQVKDPKKRTAAAHTMLTPSEKKDLMRHANRESEKEGKRVTESDIIRNVLIKSRVVKKTPGT